MEFKKFSKVINSSFNKMCEENVYVVDITKDELWEAYQNAFPKGTNEIYKERPMHDCNTCKQFIRNIGGIVVITDNGLSTVWDVVIDDPTYQVVADKMAEFVKGSKIVAPFVRGEKKYGVASNVQLLEDGQTITWDHFHCQIPSKYLSNTPSQDIAKLVANVGVFKRGLEEITEEALDTIKDLISENSIYRGQEFEKNVLGFARHLKEFKQLSAAGRDNYVWKHYKDPVVRFRNSVIGTLAVELSEGKDLESAVASYEAKVAPENYKRPKALVTKAMIENAIKKIDEIGIRDSLPRRHAVATDVSVNNVIFADRTVKMADKDPLKALLGVSDNDKVSGIENAPEIGIEDFIKNIIPNSTNISLVTSRTMEANKVNISAPVNADAPNIMKWDNNFAWSYEGNVADSSMITKNVKAAGGKIDGILRFSLQWNENGMDVTDLDLHCYEKLDNGRSKTIYYGNKISSLTGGTLDIDIQLPKGVAVENIVWQEIKNGKYLLQVHDFSGRGLSDYFDCEVVFDNITYTYRYEGNMRNGGRTVSVAEVTYKDGVFKIKHLIEPTSSVKDETLVPVKLMMYSPNYWDGQEIGNKHYIFITDDTKPDASFRGFYNEFLSNELQEHRKVMDMLASKMQCEPVEGGLSGYGFSSTKSKEIFIKADNKMYKVII